MAEVNHVVRDGDCISSIAAKYGFLWRTIWDANPALKQLRKNPNVLFPGDIVKVPELGVKEQDCPTEQKHTFVVADNATKFRLVVERYNVALANRAYTLTIDERTYQGATDATGLLEVEIAPDAQSGHLQIPSDHLDVRFLLGGLDPVEEVSGVQQRLQNLGFLTAELSGQMDEETKAAIMYFQSSVNLPASGELDETTRSRLIDMHDRPHPQQQPQHAEADAADEAGEEALEAADINTDEDDVEMARFTSLD